MGLLSDMWRDIAGPPKSELNTANVNGIDIPLTNKIIPSVKCPKCGVFMEVDEEDIKRGSILCEMRGEPIIPGFGCGTIINVHSAVSNWRRFFTESGERVEVNADHEENDGGETDYGDEEEDDNNLVQ